MLQMFLKMLLLICSGTSINITTTCNNCELTNAIVNIITDICGNSDKITSSIIFETNCLNNFTFMDTVNSIVHESSQSQNVSLRIEMENLHHNTAIYDYKKCNIIMISLCSNFMKIYDAILDTRNISMHHDSPLVIVLMDFHESHKISEIFSILWHANVYNVNVLQNDMTVVTYFPFQRHYCSDTTPVIINRFFNGQFVNSTLDFFPNKFKDLQHCPINIATANDAQPYIFVKQRANGSYSIRGRDMTLLKTLAGALNFHINFTYIGKDIWLGSGKYFFEFMKFLFFFEVKKILF